PSLRPRLDHLLDHLELRGGRALAGVNRPTGADVQRPRRRRREFLDEIGDPSDADVERREKTEALVLPWEEASADRELARRDLIAREAAVVAGIVGPAEVILAIGRDEDVVLDERADPFVPKEQLASD